MIFKIEFDDRKEYAQAISFEHLQASYKEECDETIAETMVTQISDEAAKEIMLTNMDYNEDDPESLREFSLYDASVGDDFCIVGSTEWA